MKDSKNNVIGKFNFYTKYTFTKSEKLNEPIKIALTETNFIFIFVLYYLFKGLYIV
jgi:hypothetical protein